MNMECVMCGMCDVWNGNAMNIPEPSGRFRNLPEHSLGDDGYVTKCVKYKQTHSKFPHTIRMFRNLPEGSGTFRKVPEPSRM